MKKIIIFLVVADLAVFVFAKTRVADRGNPLEYTFFIYDRAGYKHDIYKDVTSTVVLTLVSISDNRPSIIWEKKLVENVSLYELSGKEKPLIRKFNIGFVDPSSYLVYKIIYQSKDGRTLETEKATYVDKNDPVLYIGL